jgi:hypothetical protein
MQIKTWRHWGMLAVMLALSGCTSSLPFLSRTDDPEPMYKVENQPGGFTISTSFSRHQTDVPTVEAACRRGLIQNAQDLAKSMGRPIQPIEERRVRARMTMERATGMTTCDGSLPVAWVR